MNKKNIIIFIFIILVSAILFINQKNTTTYSQKEESKIKIAVCPTYHDLSKKIDKDKYEVIFTNSTAESINLLNNKKVDLILSGRNLKPHEPKSESLIIEKGYSFLSNQEKTILELDFENYHFYTDLDLEEIENSFSIKSLKKVDDVYNYLNDGIIITSWENTDYRRSEIVHVLEHNGNRLKLSRQPMLHCPNFCHQEFKELLASLK